MLNKAILLVLFPIVLSAQLPTSNIYHFTVSRVAKDIRLKSPQFLTAFNKEGYNNQPKYFGDKVIYFSTDYYDSEQTEIAKFDLFDKTLTRITYTPEKEYSPTPVENKDAFSVVRVESDDKTQTLSIYPIDGIGYAKRYLNNTSNIGYHTWLDETTVGIFLVEAPHHNLAVADAISERRKIILDKVGRCLKRDKAGNLLFVHKQGENDWYLKSYNALTSKSTIITQTLEGAEDFELLNDGTFLMGHNSKLYRFTPGSDKGWELVSDLAQYGISKISRIESYKNSLVIVESE